ncbi:MAG: YbaK/EbsC family protein [Spirochaetes bacterium]|nr:MAG: YbaK/EbsC family protein [Spirochaetota bacterium]
MPGQKLRAFLDQNSIKYVSIMHSPAYTAQGIAHSAHIPGKELAKSVIVKINGKLAMAVVPASHKLSLESLRQAVSTKNVELCREEEFKEVFPDCELGAMPPFGNLYGLEVYASRELAKDKEIAFNAGSHSELIRMDYTDFERLTKPTVLDITVLNS